MVAKLELREQCVPKLELGNEFLGSKRKADQVLFFVALALIAYGGELPDGAKLSVRFDPPRVKAGEKTALEISVTPPTGAGGRAAEGARWW